MTLLLFIGTYFNIYISTASLYLFVCLFVWLVLNDASTPMGH